MREDLQLGLPLAAISVLAVTQVGEVQLADGNTLHHLGYPFAWARTNAEGNGHTIAMLALISNFFIHLIFYFFLGGKIADFYEKINPMTVMLTACAVLMAAYTYSWWRIDPTYVMWLSTDPGAVILNEKMSLFASLEEEPM